MLNKLMNIINGLEERIFVDENDAITDKDINECGYVTIRNNELLMYNGLAIAMAGFLQFDNIENYVPMIVVDDNFMKLSENGRRFTIAHEMGHFELHATEDKLFNTEYVRNINDEFEADEFAARQMGFQSAIFALEELQEILDVTSDGMNVEGIEEMEKRIEHLFKRTSCKFCQITSRMILATLLLQ